MKRWNAAAAEGAAGGREGSRSRVGGLESMKRGLCAAAVAALLLAGVSALFPQPALTQMEGKHVLVTNAPTQAVPTYDARDAMEPFDARLFPGLDPVTVPAGKRLVIEYVGLYGGNKGGILYAPRLIVESPSGSVSIHWLSFQHSSYGPSGYTMFGGSTATRIYVEPGSTVSLRNFADGGTGQYLEGSISGYLVPAP